MNKGSTILFNILTVLVILITVLASMCYVLLVLNPDAALNPLKPPPLPTILPSPLPSATSVIDTFPTPLPATAAPSATGETPTGNPSPTFTLSPTAGASLTATLTITATAGTPTVTLAPSATGTPAAHTPSRTPANTAAGPTVVPSQTLSPLPFTLQPGSPLYQPNYANAAGCNWMGVAGQVFSLSGQPVQALIVRVTFTDGALPDATTGSNKAYGFGGYEIYFNNHVEATTGAYRIQLLNTSGSPLSDAYTINTFADCNKNLIVVNFIQNH